MKKKTKAFICLLCVLFFSTIAVAQNNIAGISTSVNEKTVNAVADNNLKTNWKLAPKDLQKAEWLMFSLQKAGDVNAITIDCEGITPQELQKLLSVYITYDRSVHKDSLMQR